VAQQLKQDVFDRICEAAIASFSTHGYEQTRLADVALAAGISAGNIYRYFADKETLFAEVAPARKATRLRNLLKARLDTFAASSDWESELVQKSGEAKALLDFLVCEKDFVLIALGDHGVSPLGSVRASVIDSFSKASQELAVKNGVADVPSLVLNHVFAGTVDVIVAILRDACGREEIEQAFRAFSLYQLAGLQALLTRGPAGGQ